MPDDRADRHQRGEAADRRGEGSKHALLGAGVAIVGVERVADEAAVAGLVGLPAAEEPDLALELHRRGGHQRNAKASERIADDQPRREIVAAVDDEVMAGEQRFGIVGGQPLLGSPRPRHAD